MQEAIDLSTVTRKEMLLYAYACIIEYSVSWFFLPGLSDGGILSFTGSLALGIIVQTVFWAFRISIALKAKELNGGILQLSTIVFSFFVNAAILFFLAFYTKKFSPVFGFFIAYYLCLINVVFIIYFPKRMN